MNKRSEASVAIHCAKKPCPSPNSVIEGNNTTPSEKNKTIDTACANKPCPNSANTKRTIKGAVRDLCSVCAKAIDARLRTPPRLIAVERVVENVSKVDKKRKCEDAPLKEIRKTTKEEEKRATFESVFVLDQPSRQTAVIDSPIAQESATRPISQPPSVEPVHESPSKTYNEPMANEPSPSLLVSSPLPPPPPPRVPEKLLLIESVNGVDSVKLIFYDNASAVYPLTTTLYNQFVEFNNNIENHAAYDEEEPPPVFGTKKLDKAQFSGVSDAFREECCSPSHAQRLANDLLSATTKAANELARVGSARIKRCARSHAPILLVAHQEDEDGVRPTGELTVAGLTVCESRKLAMWAAPIAPTISPSPSMQIAPAPVPVTASSLAHTSTIASEPAPAPAIPSVPVTPPRPLVAALSESPSPTKPEAAVVSSVECKTAPTEAHKAGNPLHIPAVAIAPSSSSSETNSADQHSGQQQQQHPDTQSSTRINVGCYAQTDAASGAPTLSSSSSLASSTAHAISTEGTEQHSAAAVASSAPLTDYILKQEQKDLQGEQARHVPPPSEDIYDIELALELFSDYSSSPVSVDPIREDLERVEQQALQKAHALPLNQLPPPSPQLLFSLDPNLDPVVLDDIIADLESVSGLPQSEAPPVAPSYELGLSLGAHVFAIRNDGSVVLHDYALKALIDSCRVGSNDSLAISSRDDLIPYGTSHASSFTASPNSGHISYGKQKQQQQYHHQNSIASVDPERADALAKFDVTMDSRFVHASFGRRQIDVDIQELDARFLSNVREYAELRANRRGKAGRPKGTEVDLKNAIFEFFYAKLH